MLNLKTRQIPGVAGDVMQSPPPANTKRMESALRVGFVASFPPRQCGIATFTQDVLTSVEAISRLPSVVAAVNDRPNGYQYGNRVRLQIDRNDMGSYAAAAAAMARSGVDVINVQHEYGLFGGTWGEYLLGFYNRARQPIVTTLHSVIPNPEHISMTAPSSVRTSGTISRKRCSLRIG